MLAISFDVFFTSPAAQLNVTDHYPPSVQFLTISKGKDKVALNVI